MSLSKLWAKLTAQYADKRQRRLHKSLTRESHDSIQLMEFESRLYICHNGVPVVDVEQLTDDAVDVIKKSRKVWINFKLRELNIENGLLSEIFNS